MDEIPGEDEVGNLDDTVGLSHRLWGRRSNQGFIGGRVGRLANGEEPRGGRQQKASLMITATFVKADGRDFPDRRRERP